MLRIPVRTIIAAICGVGIVSPALAEQSTFSAYGRTRVEALVNAKQSAQNFMLSPRVLDRIEEDGCSPTGKDYNPWECAVTAYYHLED